MRGPLTARRVTALAIVLLLVPTVASGVLYYATTSETPDRPAAPIDPANLTVVTTQGSHWHGNGPNFESGQMVGIRSDNGSVVWTNDRYGWYYDVDPITNRTLLFVSHDRVDGEYRDFATEWNWVTNETYRRFRLPPDTHDVDRLGPDRYVVADKANNRVFVYNYTADEPPYDATDEIVWQWRFREHYDDPPIDGHEGDYTHLNDVDVIENGSAFMLSPRNFNRVIAVNRSTGEIEWTLGNQVVPSILDGQHSPVMLSTDPRTVLVGDSENNRVVEYQYVDGAWEQTWAYSDGLNWPRAVRRLPNGDTLVSDTGNDRVIEVTPNGTVVWQYDTRDPHPFDVERVALRDGRDRPTMGAYRNGSVDLANGSEGSTTLPPLEYAHRLAGWVLPIWVGKWAFLGLVLAGVLAVGWALTEAGLAVRRRV
ncbi:MAG: aryl-sulfate sulfotransferase [Haloarculaceae archaeon]